jgi:hypothetical protein
MTLTVLTTKLAEAVAKDETPKAGGCDLSAGLFGPCVSEWLRELAKALCTTPQPLDVVLHCPKCGKQHIDKDNSEEVRIEAAERGFTHGSRDWEVFVEEREWTNPPHRSHFCHYCGHVWRPADVPTNGVATTKTRGKNDSPKELP